MRIYNDDGPDETIALTLCNMYRNVGSISPQPSKRNQQANMAYCADRLCRAAINKNVIEYIYFVSGTSA